uniref:Uncharacterized protein n=1 Tax=Candidatus Kentrum sp. TC TaxID=2126339 RepID=A0A450YJ89_9GAMM|nr:MAG: hypothetical protein BECKTC1821E_GA0114239_101226 [Candidatus Kentron sp. TC]
MTKNDHVVLLGYKNTRKSLCERASILDVSSQERFAPYKRVTCKLGISRQNDQEKQERQQERILKFRLAR